MTVNEIKPNLLCLEYRQEEGDEDYGSCLWARFVFNLDRYELYINSDCGSYGYKWFETPNSESFLELMARCDKWYILQKMYGSADLFDYEATKAKIYEMETSDDEDEEEVENKKKLDEIFEELEWECTPDSSDVFIEKFERANDYCDGWFSEIWEYCEFDYPADALKIADVFEKCIQPKIEEILKEQK